MSFGGKFQDLKGASAVSRSTLTRPLGALFALEDLALGQKESKLFLVVRKMKLISADSAFPLSSFRLPGIAFETFGKPEYLPEVPSIKALAAAAMRLIASSLPS